MTVYLIADIKITDDRWVPDYAAKVHKLVERHGGRYLSRSGNIANLEGGDQDSTLIALISFPSREAVEAFAADPDYAPLRQGTAGRERQPLPVDRRHRPCRDDPLSQGRLTKTETPGPWAGRFL